MRFNCSYRLTINQPAASSQSFTECAPYSVTVGLNTYTSTGVFSDTLTASNGCDSVVTTNLTINQPASISQTLTECAPFSVTVGTNTYSTTGNYIDTLVGSNSCDSIVTTNLTVNPTATTTATTTICTGNSYSFGTQTLSSAGIYTEVFTSIYSCDSTVTLTLSVVSAFNETASATICAGDTFVLGTQDLTSSGVFTELFVSSGGCDSTVTLTLTVNNPTSLNQTFVECAPFSVTVGTNTYTSSGVYTDVLVNANGCDSTVTTDLTINQPGSSAQTYVECSPFSVTVGTNTYTTTGVYSDTLVNAAGCDSVVTTNLTINLPSQITQTFVENSGFSVTVGSNTYSTTGVYTDSLVSVNGCDSIIITDLTIIAASLNFDGTDDQVSCGNILTPSYTKEAWIRYEVSGQYNNIISGTANHAFWILNGVLSAGHNGSWSQVTDGTNFSPNTWTHVAVSYDAATSTMKLFKNGVIVSTNNFVPNINSDNSVFIGTYSNMAFFKGNIDEVRIWDRALCDGEIQNNMNCVLSSSAAGLIAYYDFNQNVADGNNAGDTILSDAGGNNYNGILSNFALSGNVSNWTASGGITSGVSCTPFVPVTVSQTLVACEGDTIFVGNNGYSTTGIYTDTLESSTGCDSILVTELTITPAISTSASATICNNAYIFGTQTLTTAGVYTEVFQNINGCDSTVTLTLSVVIAYTESATASICLGDVYVFGTQNLTSAGVYSELFASAGGCDSTVTLTLNVNNSVAASQTFVECTGFSVAVGANTYNTTGIYIDTLVAANGCDSIVTTDLTINQPVSFSQTFVECTPYSVTVGSNTYSVSGIYTDTLVASNSCDSIVTTELTVNPVYNESAVASICNGTYIFGDTTLTTAGTFTKVFQSVSGCDSTVTLTLSIVTAFNETASATICNGDVYAFGTQNLTAAGVYTELFQSSGGCDSTVTLTLAVNNSTSGSQTFVECAGFSVTVGTNTYNTTGVYTDTFVGANGCDSIVTTDLTINQPTLGSQTFVECAGFSVTVGTNTYNTTGVYTDTFVGANGCDSIVTTDLTINQPTSGSQTFVECAGFSVTVGTNTYSTTGVYTDILGAANGCDSIVTTDLTINQVDVSVTQNGMMLTANAAGATYQWVDCNNGYAPVAGATSQSYSATTDGNYAVVITQNNCTDTSVCTTLTSVDNIISGRAGKVNIYPNPGSGLFTMEVQTAISSDYVITDILGNILMQRAIVSNKTVIDLTEFESGVYFISVNNKVVKLVKH